MERLRVVLSHSGSRFIILYGAGLGDGFVTNYGGKWDFDHGLSRVLRDAGFGQIAFYAPQWAVYYADPDSRRRGRLAPGLSLRAGPSARQRLFSGPLGDARVAMAATALSQPERMGDPGALILLNAIMVGAADAPSAVVLHADAEPAGIYSRPELIDLLDEWAALPATNHNVCIWAFHVASDCELGAAVLRHRQPRLEDLLGSAAAPVAGIPSRQA